MRTILTSLAIVGVLLGLPVHAQAQRSVSAALLSQQRLGPACSNIRSTTDVALSCWLDHHPDVAAAMAYGDSSWNGNFLEWPAWPNTTRRQLVGYFNQMVLWYSAGMPKRYPGLFPMPITPGGPFQSANGTSNEAFWMIESVGMKVYLAEVANSLAAELTGAFPWSIANYTPDELHLLLHMNDYMYYGPEAPTPGFFFQGTAAAPAVPGFTVRFFKTSNLIGVDATDTVARLYEWERSLYHWFSVGGKNENALDFWGPDTPPVPDQVVINGRVYSGPVGGVDFGHFTAGCSGTTSFTKSVLRAMNIPVQRHGLLCQHVLPIFPTLGLAWTHGDDPYDRTGWVTPLPGMPSPKTLDYFIKAADLDTLFPPGQDDNTCEHTVGVQVANIAIQFGSDDLMNKYCQDLASGADHASGKVYDYMDYWYTLDALENMGLWTTLANKAAITNYCQP